MRRSGSPGMKLAAAPTSISSNGADVPTRRANANSATTAVRNPTSNVACSWAHAAVRFGFRLRLASPAELRPGPLLAWAEREGGDVSFTTSPREAVTGADLVVTDTWFSMGVAEGASREQLLAPYRVDEALMALAKPDALFMHCLPAHRDQEVAAGVIDGPQSVVWDEAENRLHAQKGILAWCIGSQAAERRMSVA